jgi:hypothetical protein
MRGSQRTRIAPLLLFILYLSTANVRVIKPVRWSESQGFHGGPIAQELFHFLLHPQVVQKGACGNNPRLNAEIGAL